MESRLFKIWFLVRLYMCICRDRFVKAPTGFCFWIDELHPDLPFSPERYAVEVLGLRKPWTANSMYWFWLYDYKSRLRLIRSRIWELMTFR